MRKILTGALAALFLSLGASARDIKPDFSIPLYPGGQEIESGIIENGLMVTGGPLESNGFSGELKYKSGFVSNVGDQARIDIYLPRKCNGQMVVVTPGGGYGNVSMRNEGELVAKWLNSKGIAACVVLYRLPNFHHRIPLNDVHNAIRYCRLHAEEWGISKVGIMGFSAGGHLAGCASNIYDTPEQRPDFAVLIYPVVTLERGVTHKGTAHRLTGDVQTLIDYYSLEKRVSSNTPPTIIISCEDDRTVPIENSLRYYSAMVKHGVPGELHVFTNGGHGWGFTTSKYGEDKLGAKQRADFFKILSRWLKDQE